MRDRAAFGLLVIVMTLLTSGSAVTAGGESAGDEPPLYGLLSGPPQEHQPLFLTKLDPRTLAPIGTRRIAVARRMTLAGRSPDGRLAAFYERQPARLRVIDLETMQVRGDLPLKVGKRWRIREAAWLTADRVVFVVQRLRGSYEQIVDTRQIVVVDPLALRVVARRPFANAMALNAAAQGGDKLVLLLGRGDLSTRTLRLVVVGSGGDLRATSLTLEGSTPTLPSLVVEPSGGRAYVIAAGTPVLDVDLATLEVVRRPVTGAGRLFAPSSFATRGALRIDERTLAVFGADHIARAEVEITRPAGLALIDTSSWQARVIDEQATGATFSAGTLLAYGWRLESTRTAKPRQRAVGIGLRAYEPSGTLRWQRFPGQALAAAATRNIALVYRNPVSGPGGSFPVELATGRQTGRVRPAEQNIWLLPEPSPPKRTPAAAETSSPAIEITGDGEAFTGRTRDDVSRIVAVLVDGSEQEIPLEESQFAYRSESPERGARAVRAYSGEELLATVSLHVRCGGSAGPCAAATPGRSQPTYAVVGELPTGGAALVRVDPRTLTPMTGGLRLKAPFSFTYARSPDGKRVALAVREQPLIRIVDLERLRIVRELRLGAAGTEARTLAWMADDRLVVVAQRMSRPTRRYVRERSVVTLDPRNGLLVARRPVTNKLAIHGAVQAAGRFVLMLQSSSHKGSSVELVVIDIDGTVRTRAVEVGQRGGVLHTTQLAVEPAGRRAFLFGWALRRNTPPVIEIDLDTLAIRSHRLRIDHAGDLPRAAISGLDVAAVDDRYVAAAGAVAASERVEGRVVPAAGIFLIDTRSWEARLVDPRAMYFQSHEGRLVTYGPSNRLAELRRQSGRGSGVTAYELPGRRLYHLYGNRPFSKIEFAGAYGHVLPGQARSQRLVFDVRSGKPLGMLPALKRPLEVLGPPPPRPRDEAVPSPPNDAASSTRDLGKGAQNDPYARVSNRGSRVQAKAEKPGQREMTPRDLSLLRRDEGRAVYRIGGLRPGYTACYGSGRSGEIGRLGSIACGRSGFPSRRQPLFEMSAIELRRGDERPRLFRLEGVAVDAIAEVGLTDADGDVIARVPVADNVYLLASPPAGATGDLVAYDRDGAIVYRTDRGREKPPPGPAGSRRLAGFRVKLTLPPGWTGEVRRSSAGRARALILAGNQLPARDQRSVSLAIAERDPRATPAFPLAAVPPRIAARDIRATGGRYGRAEHDFTFRGRQFTLELTFGTPTPAASVLGEVNRLLGTLEVGAIAVPPSAAAAGTPLQRGGAEGVAVDVFRSGVVVFRFNPASRLYRLIGGKRVSVACLTFDSVSPWEPNEWWASKPLAPTVQFIVNESTRPEQPYATLEPATEAKPPFDGCLVSGSYGRRWNDPRGQHSPAEIGFTARGRRFFDERAVARDLALFVRTPAIRAVRREMRNGRVPSAAAIARRFPSRVVALKSHDAFTLPGVIGLWVAGEVIHVSERTPAGRPLFVRLRDGRIGAHNLEGLAFVF